MKLKARKTKVSHASFFPWWPSPPSPVTPIYYWQNVTNESDDLDILFVTFKKNYKILGETLNNNSGGKMQSAICWSGSTHLHLLSQKSNSSSHIVTTLKFYGCALWCHSFQNSIRKLTVSYSNIYNRLINVPRYTSSSLAFAMNATDHINVVYTQICLQLDQQSKCSQQYCNYCHCQWRCISWVSTNG